METVCMKFPNLFSEKNEKKKFQYVVCWKLYPECFKLNEGYGD